LRAFVLKDSNDPGWTPDNLGVIPGVLLGSNRDRMLRAFSLGKAPGFFPNVTVSSHFHFPLEVFPDSATASVFYELPVGMSTKRPSVGPKEFPLTLRAWRTQRKLKVASAASALGVSASTWTHWETGQRFPTGCHLMLLSSFTGIELACLVCEKRPALTVRLPTAIFRSSPEQWKF
jgi:hypothetical protein